MPIKSKSLIVIVALLMLGLAQFLATPRPSLAQTPVPTVTPTLVPGAQEIDITWVSLKYNDRKLASGRPETIFDFDIPGDQVFVPGSYVRLVLSHTGTPATPGSLIIALNDHVLSLIPLTDQNDDRGQIQLDILPEYLIAGRNRLSISLTSADSCVGPGEQPLEVVIHSEGLLHLAYEVVPRQPDLALYPIPFSERSFEPVLTYFVLPDSPSSNDMALAATISAGLGSYSGGAIQVKAVAAAELPLEVRANNNLIVIGRPEENSFFSQLDLPFSLKQLKVGADQGMLQEIQSPWNARRMILVVTANSDEGLNKAAAALNRQILFPSFKGQIVIVEKLLDPPINAAEALKTDFTFEDLNYKDMVMYGTRPTSQRFSFYLPNAWQMSGDPSLQLLFTHSEALSGTTSTLDVTLNGVPLDGTVLDNSNSKDGLLQVDLLSWLLRSGRNDIEVSLSMSLGGADPCLSEDSHQAWTVINRNSTLHLPYQPEPSALDLANLPQPFSDDPNLSNTYFVLPDTVNPSEQDALLSFAVQLGAAARGGYLALQIGQADALSSTLKQTYDIVAIGQPSTNPFIAEVNEHLPQPFLPDSDEPSQVNNSAIINFDPERSIGFVQLIPSPWNAAKAMLVITGTDQAGVAAALSLLTSPEHSLKGNLALIEDNNLVTVDIQSAQEASQAPQSSSEQPSQFVEKTVQAAQAERWW